MTQPLAITCGDPGGVGLEISLKAWQQAGLPPFFLIADLDHMAPVSAQLGIPVREIACPEDTNGALPHGLPVLHHAFAQPASPGQVCLQNAASVIAVIDQAVELVKTGQAAALCTNPINKKILHDGAGFAWPGHTEYLAHLGGVTRSVMMLSAPELKVVPVTIHIALAEVARALTPQVLEQTIRLTHRAMLRDFGIASPRMAIAGLNPHAGEGGAMGAEELAMIGPLLDRLRDEGFDLIGPMPADTMFHAAARANYDVAVCMYHDQALIPIKTLNFSAGVNTTLGLPFVRTSPDHGTAFDIAGKGVADATSLAEALKLAASMAHHRKTYDKVYDENCD
jgi:4-hydroxythreonine-4-phosphate dehydrogenase